MFPNTVQGSSIWRHYFILNLIIMDLQLKQITIQDDQY